MTNQIVDVRTATLIAQQMRRLVLKHGASTGQRCYSTKRKTSRTVKWWCHKPAVIAEMSAILTEQGIPFEVSPGFLAFNRGQSRPNVNLTIHTEHAFALRAVPVEPPTEGERLKARMDDIYQRTPRVREYVDLQRQLEQLAPKDRNPSRPLLFPPPPRATRDLSDLAATVRRLTAEHLGVEPERVVDSALIIDDLGADSLDTVELVMCFEEEFNVEVDDDTAEACNTVGDVIAALRRLGAE